MPSAKTRFLTIAFMFLGFCYAQKVNRTIIMSPKLPQIGKYSHGILVDSTLYISGQIGFNKEGLMVPGGIETETRQTLRNIGHVLSAVGAKFEDIVKVTVYLQNISDAAVMNNVYSEFFPKNYPARATIGTSSLLLDALIEIEAVAVLDSRSDNSAGFRVELNWICSFFACLTVVLNLW